MELVFEARVADHYTIAPQYSPEMVAALEDAWSVLGALQQDLQAMEWSRNLRGRPRGVDFDSTILAIADVVRNYAPSRWSLRFECERLFHVMQYQIVFRLVIATAERAVVTNAMTGEQTALDVPTRLFRGQKDAAPSGTLTPSRPAIAPARRFNLRGAR